MTSTTPLPSRSNPELHSNEPVSTSASAGERGPNSSRDQKAVGEVVEDLIAEKRIGERIKALRLKKSMGLVELGKHTGLSASFLSQLETGRVVPTLRNLARIAMVFSKDLTYFFEPEPRTLFRLHRLKDRVRMPQTGVDDPTYFFESLAYLVPDRHLDPYYAEFLPGKEDCQRRSHQHGGCEFLYVLSGALEVRHGEEAHRLEAGDSAYFDASTVHSYACAGNAPATALIVTLQQPAAAVSAARSQATVAQQRERNQTVLSAQPANRPAGPVLRPLSEMGRDGRSGDGATRLTRRAV
jgi:transcriptional regulator with XRE-family HTH domain